MKNKPMKIIERMRQSGVPYFTGREKEIKEFTSALDIVLSGDFEKIAKTKHIFHISGEGGMGKTSLIWEFEKICRQRKLQPIFIDVRPWEDRHIIGSIVDFLLILRKHLGQLPIPKLIGVDPFEKFDHLNEKFQNLDKTRKIEEEKQRASSTNIDTFSKIGAKIAVGAGEQLPFGKMVTSIVGDELVEQGIEIAIKSIAEQTKDLHNRLLRVFGNQADVDFYINHDEKLLLALAESIEQIADKYQIVLLIDSYEELIEMEIRLRETFFAQLPETILLVFSGRNSIRDSCSPEWIKWIRFFDMKEFSPEETEEYLQKRDVNQKQIIDNIFDFTQGVPFAVAIAADSISEGLFDYSDNQSFPREDYDPSKPIDANKIISKVAKRFLNLVDKDEYEIIKSCAVMGEFTSDFLQYMVSSKYTKDLYDKLQRYSFVRDRGNSLVIHKVVRSYVLQTIKNAEPEKYSSLHSKAAQYFEAKITKLRLTSDDEFGNEKWKRLTLQRLYHLLQSADNNKESIFYQIISEGMWNGDYEFCLGAVNVTKQPVRFEVPGLQTFEVACYSLVNKELNDAGKNLDNLLPVKVNCDYFYQMANDTLGDLEQNLGNYAKAVERYNIALKYFRVFNDLNKIATTQQNIANCLMMDNNIDESIKFLKECIEIRTSIGEKKRLAYSMEMLGILYRRKTNYFEAISELEKSQSVYKEIGEFSSFADVNNELGITYRLWGKPEQALQYYKIALEEYEKLGAQAMLADVLVGMGIAYKDWKKYDDAIPEFQKSREIYTKLDQIGSAADMDFWIGVTFAEKKDPQNALNYLNLALENYQKVTQKSDAASVLLEIGKIYLGQKNYRQAIDIYDDSLKLYEELSDWNGVVRSLFNIGIIYRDNEDYLKAIEYFQKCRTISIEQHQDLDVANLDNHIGTSYRLWKKFPSAIDSYTKSYNEFEKLEKKDNLADILLNLGLTYKDWGKYPESILEFEKSRVLYESLQQIDQDIDAQFLIGTSYEEWEKYDKALEIYKEILKWFEDKDKYDDIANVYIAIGRNRLECGKYLDAIDSFTEAKKLYIEYLNKPENIAKIYNQIGITYRKSGNHNEVIEYYSLALEEFNKINDKAGMADVILGKGIVFRNSGKYSLSLDEFEKSREIFESLNLANRIASSYTQKAITYLDWRKFADAVKFHNLALEKQDDEFQKALIYLGLGITYYEQKVYKAALDAFEQSLNICNQLDWSVAIPYRLCEIAKAHSKLGNYPLAEERIQDAINLSTKLDGIEEQAYCYKSLVFIYGDMSRLDDARKFYNKAIELYGTFGARIEMANLSLEMGRLESNIGMPDNSITLFNSAIEIYREMDARLELAKSLMELGKIQYKLQMPNAKETLHQSHAVFTEICRDEDADEVKQMISNIN